MTPGRSRNSVANVELVETWIRYDVAPPEAPHESVGLADTFVAPLTGEANTGAGGGAGPVAVVKLRVADQALVPPALVAFTRQ